MTRAAGSKKGRIMKRLFFSQSMLDSMIEAGKIRVEQSILTMLTADNPAFMLRPAYRFVKTIQDGPDAAGLVGQIRSERELKEMHAEIYLDSVIHQDVAYQVDPGFIAEKVVAAPESAASPAAEAEPAKDGEKSDDPDQLSKFILDNLL